MRLRVCVDLLTSGRGFHEQTLSSNPRKLLVALGQSRLPNSQTPQCLEVAPAAVKLNSQHMRNEASGALGQLGQDEPASV